MKKKKISPAKPAVPASSRILPILAFYAAGLLIICRCTQLSYHFGYELFSGGLAQAGDRIMAFVRMILRWFG